MLKYYDTILLVRQSLIFALRVYCFNIAKAVNRVTFMDKYVVPLEVKMAGAGRGVKGTCSPLALKFILFSQDKIVKKTVHSAKGKLPCSHFVSTSSHSISIWFKFF
jgi:hypothetical protein